MKKEFGLEPGTGIQMTQGEKYESIAFTFCKVATVALLAQKFTLPVAAGLSAIFYLAAYVKGKHDTRCWLRWPLLIAGLWAWVCAVSLYTILNPGIWRHIINWIN